MVSAIWPRKQDLHTAIHCLDPHAQNAQRIAARLEATRRQLREWHERRPKDPAQEQQRHLQNLKPYKSVEQMHKILGDSGHRGIRAVHLHDGTVTSDLKMVTEEVRNSFERQHNAEDWAIQLHQEPDITPTNTIQPDTRTRHALHPFHHMGMG